MDPSPPSPEKAPLLGDYEASADASVPLPASMPLPASPEASILPRLSTASTATDTTIPLPPAPKRRRYGLVIAGSLLAVFLFTNFITSVVLFATGKHYALALYGLIMSVLGFALPVVVGGVVAGCYRWVYLKGKQQGMREYQIRLDSVDETLRRRERGEV